jgi:hypothetical protein
MRSRTVDLAAVADIDDQDEQAIVDDLVYDAMVTDADAVKVSGATELGAPMWSRLAGEHVDSFAQAVVKFAVGEIAECLFRAAQDLNRVGHQVRA